MTYECAGLGAPAWLLCMGMPKCGTTTVAALLDANPHLAIHNQKEPNDFASPLDGGLPSLAGYVVTPRTRYLGDFSTLNGMPWNRSCVIDNLVNSGELSKAYFIVALRDPAALAESFFHHMLSRRGYEPGKDAHELKRHISGATDFRGLLAELLNRVDAHRVFITKLEGLATVSVQRETVEALSDWLQVPAHLPDAQVVRNEPASARRYIPAIENMVLKLRSTRLVRQLSPRTRRKFSRLVSRRAWSVKVEFDLESWADPQVIADSGHLYRHASIGPLSRQPGLIRLLNDRCRAERVSR